jgi:hypothetical protein
MISLTSSLKRALKAPTESRYSNDDKGMYEVALAWRMPDITPEWIEEARRALPLVNQALQLASYQKRRTWVAKVGVLCTGKTENARAKVDEYAELLEVPDIVLNAENLREAGRRFTYFPSFKDLDRFLSELADPIRQLKVRLEVIANAVPSLLPNTCPVPSNGGKTYTELDDDGKAKHERLMMPFRTGGSENGRRRDKHSISEIAKPRSAAARAIIESSLVRSLDGRESGQSRGQSHKMGGQ